MTDMHESRRRKSSSVGNIVGWVGIVIGIGLDRDLDAVIHAEQISSLGINVGQRTPSLRTELDESDRDALLAAVFDEPGFLLATRIWQGDVSGGQRCLVGRSGPILKAQEADR